jgi:hypothetical protein
MSTAELLADPQCVAAADAAPNHSPLWMVDERGLLPGLRSLLHAVVDYTGSGAA